MTHCCNTMTNFVQNQNSPIKYDPVVDDYRLENKCYNSVKDFYLIVEEPIFYCPWCKKQLPKIYLYF